MRKIYSLVLMATMLLIGTNAWAELHDAPQQASDEAKVQINGGAWQYASTLKEAFDAVEMEQTATIVLLNHVTYERKSYSEDYGITIPHVIVAADMSGANAKKGPNITLNLNGKNIETGTGIHNDSITIFRLVKGTLNITGTGTIHKPGAIGAGESTWCGSAAIAVGGTNDKTATNWSTLTIGKDVTVHVETKYTKGYKTKAIAIVNQAGVGGSLKNPNDVLRATGTGDHHNPANMLAKYGYYTRAGNSYISSLSADEKGCVAGDVWGTAYGVKVIIEGTVIGPMYGVHMHGNINARPNCVNDSCEKRSKYLPAPYHQYQFPYINITSTAHVRATDTVGTTGIYSSGYGVLDVSGEVEGATGIYMKGGDVLLKDAIVKSNVTESGQNEGGNSGIGSAAGSGIVIETSEYYAGNSGVTVAGDTKVTGGGGYAIQDRTTSDELGSTTSHITIEGGTIEGGKEGAIVITEGTVDVTSIAGGNLSSNTVTVDKGNDVKETVTVNNFLVAGTHTTVVKDGNKDIVVVSQGAAPTDYAHVQGNAKDSVNWIGTGADATEELNDNLTLKELEINQDWVQTLTIPNGKTLSVGRVVLGVNARIIVEAGGKFIVTGEQGIVAPKTSNIVLQTSGSKQAEFLFNHAVTSNRHPNATVEMQAKVGKLTVGAEEYREWHRFAVPVLEIKEFGKNPNWSTYLYAWDYVNDDWYKPSSPLEIMKPFEGFTLSPVNEYGDITYTFKGQLVGNDNHNLKFIKEGFNFFGNSYTAYMSVEKLIAQLTEDGSDFEPTIWTWYSNHYHAVPLKALKDNPAAFNDNHKQIKPMQTFILRLVDANEAETELNYKDAIWGNPRYASLIPNAAPARRAARNDNTFMRIILSAGEDNADDVMFMEQSKFSDAIDNGYDASKFMNEQGVNIFATVDGSNFSAVATDNVEGKMLSIRTANEATYSLSFSNVKGAEYAIRDNVTNQVIAIEEGASYEFAAQPNTTIEGRFEIISVKKVPTAIENTEVKANVKGIYTLMGQYLGEDFEALPAGVYVVNGVKIVK